MLNLLAPQPRASLEAVQRREFARLGSAAASYLDYAGSALYGVSQLRAHHDLLDAAVLGNPHSANLPSRHSTEAIDEARGLVLEFLDAPAETYTVCFTANASAAIKLVGESYPFDAQHGYLLSTDNHNSMNGVREFARRAGAPVVHLPLTAELRLFDPLGALRRAGCRGLLGFPAQSNFSGVRHPLELIDAAQDLGFEVLLDLAAYAPTHAFSLREHPADFVALSFYKIFGYPTGVGALVARRSSLQKLARPWFAGGTVNWVSTGGLRHQAKPLHEGFEDGTANFLSILALSAGFQLVAEVGLDRLEGHVKGLTATLLAELLSLRHSSGTPLCRLYGPATTEDRGGVVAFNVLDVGGDTFRFEDVEERANAAGVALRGGCFCNPGASEVAFGTGAAISSGCLDTLGDEFSYDGLRSCLGPGVAVGAVRASLGLANTVADVDRAVAVAASFRDQSARR